MGDNIIDLEERRQTKAKAKAKAAAVELDLELDEMYDELIPDISRKDFIGFTKVLGYIRSLSGDGSGSVDFDLEDLTVILNDYIPEDFDDVHVSKTLVLTETFTLPFYWDSLEIKKNRGKITIGDVATAVEHALHALKDSEPL